MSRSKKWSAVQCHFVKNLERDCAKFKQAGMARTVFVAVHAHQFTDVPENVIALPASTAQQIRDESATPLDLLSHFLERLAQAQLEDRRSYLN